jgi:large subunit ribosomal protein L29
MKSAEIKDLSINDLQEKIAEMELMQQKVVITHSISPLENPLQIRWSRRDIARLKTELRKRELEA